MDYLSIIREPITAELSDFIRMFNHSLEHENGLLQQALDHIRQRAGKRMRPILIFLMARNYGSVTDVTQHAAVGLELLHTASLVHDDVVDESRERRGQESVNALYDNKVAVLVGDYILSTALLNVSYTHSEKIVRYLAELGRTLSDGEILQLSSIDNEEISEETYYNIIKNKTAALFEACSAIGALSAGASDEDVERAKLFGRQLGIIFQIRDDIFDYYNDEKEIGKPTGNDMTEGKLTASGHLCAPSHRRQGHARTGPQGEKSYDFIGRNQDFGRFHHQQRRYRICRQAHVGVPRKGRGVPE